MPPIQPVLPAVPTPCELAATPRPVLLALVRLAGAVEHCGSPHGWIRAYAADVADAAVKQLCAPEPDPAEA